MTHSEAPRQLLGASAHILLYITRTALLGLFTAFEGRFLLYLRGANKIKYSKGNIA